MQEEEAVVVDVVVVVVVVVVVAEKEEVDAQQERRLRLASEWAVQRRREAEGWSGTDASSARRGPGWNDALGRKAEGAAEAAREAEADLLLAGSHFVIAASAALRLYCRRAAIHSAQQRHAVIDRLARPSHPL